MIDMVDVILLVVMAFSAGMIVQFFLLGIAK